MEVSMKGSVMNEFSNFEKLCAFCIQPTPWANSAGNRVPLVLSYLCNAVPRNFASG